MVKIEDIHNAKRLLDNVSHDLRELRHENENLRIMLYRLAANDGKCWTGNIDGQTLEEIKTANIRLEDGRIWFAFLEGKRSK